MMIKWIGLIFTHFRQVFVAFGVVDAFIVRAINWMKVNKNLSQPTTKRLPNTGSFTHTKDPLITHIHYIPIHMSFIGVFTRYSWFFIVASFCIQQGCHCMYAYVCCPIWTKKNETIWLHYKCFNEDKQSKSKRKLFGLRKTRKKIVVRHFATTITMERNQL